MKDYDTRVQTPRKCIRDYCLMHCERDKRKNSKRDVVECIIRDCPLHPYRTGQLKARSGPISETTKSRRIARLERARHLVETAERDVGRAKEKVEAKQAVVEDYKCRLHAEEKKLESRKEAVRKLEMLFNDELEAGIWDTHGETEE